MNELDVLRDWRPADATEPAVPDPEGSALAALRTRMASGRGSGAHVGRRLVGRAVLATAVTAALVAGGVMIARRAVDAGADRVGRVHVGSGALDDPAPGAPMTVLVIGTDSRAFVQDAAQAEAFGTPQQASGQRADTMILVRVDGDDVSAVWLPRDLVVPDATGGRVQLNSFLDAGPAAVVDAVRTATGEPVDHYVSVDFPGFTRVVDALGGVRMYVPAPMRDLFTGLAVSAAGCTTFDGTTALAWARSRHAQYQVDGRWTDASPRVDLDRIARQQALLRAVGAQLRARVGSDPGRVRALLDRVFPSLTVDDRMSRDTVESFAAHLVRPGRFDAVTAPSQADPTMPGRLRLRERPAGADFLTWAIDAAGATGTPAAPTPGSSVPSVGASC
jgi:LCP family protein required for cell wall assembly